MEITLQDVYLARKRIGHLVRRTPLVPSPWLSEMTGGVVMLKLENRQETGAFKLRGATNKLCSLSGGERERGVVTVSTGNHGRAVAVASRRLGIRAVVCLSENVPSEKVQPIRELGAQVIVHGKSYDEAEEYAAQMEIAEGLTHIDPFDDPFVVAGQGTIGLELLDEMPEIDTAVVPLSGGGLISGIALALKSANRAIRIVGVSMERAPVMYHSLRVGRPVEIAEEPTLADALAGGIGKNNRYTFRLVQQLVDETVLVSEQEIASAMAFALDKHHEVVEGGGAVAVASILHGRISRPGHRTAVIVSGGNVDIARLLEVGRDYLPARTQ